MISSDSFDLEKLYSPSICSRRATNTQPDSLIASFIEIQTNETNLVRKTYKNRCNVKYGSRERESVDIYFKYHELGTTIFVYVHGGCWTSLDKNSSGICVAPLVEKNCRVIAVDYNLCPDVTLEELTEQMKKFYKFLIEYAETTNAPAIYLCGHSAGAHLIATLFQEDNFHQLIKGMFLIAGIYDLRELRKTEAVNPRNVLSLDEYSAIKLSPMLSRISETLQNTKVYILVGEHDSPKFVEQSLNFSKLLMKKGVPTEFIKFPDYDHFTIVEDMRNGNSKITTLLCQTIFD